MNQGKELFVLNRSLLDEVSYKRLIELERPWIAEIFDSLKGKSRKISSRAEFKEAFNSLIDEEKHAPDDGADYIANALDFEQFRVILQEFAVDGLTEAQAFFAIVPRLPITAQMPVLRIIIDEFGCGNLQQAHSKLYRQLLTEVGMPTSIDNYLDLINPESYAFLNIFYWMTQRAPNVEYFLGALAYLESMVPFAFKCFADACQRLKIVNSQYYTEHIHIDKFHAEDALRALWAVESAVGIDYSKAWEGVQIASIITAQAFDSALKKAKKRKQIEVINPENNVYFSCPSLTASGERRSFSVKLGEQEYLLPVACPHRQGKLNLGTLNENKGTITCPLHFSKFDIATGKKLSGPACSSLRVVKLSQETISQS